MSRVSFNLLFCFVNSNGNLLTSMLVLHSILMFLNYLILVIWLGNSVANLSRSNIFNANSLLQTYWISCILVGNFKWQIDLIY